MRTNTWFEDLDTLDAEDGVTRADLIGYYHPREIVADMSLTVGRRRELVSFWLSDFNAVRGAPGLRRSGAGVTATVDDLRAALADLDAMADFVPPNGSTSSRLGA
jgi:hypothetical protein